MKAFVAADVHGNLDLLTGLLRQVGIIDEGGERIDAETRTIHLGDLCNCVGTSVVDDERCLDHVGKWFDDYLVGNHEHPYFGGPRFYGFWSDSAVGSRLRRAVTGAAVAVDGVLVTHAGLTIEWELVDDSAEQAAEWLNDTWQVDPTARVFSQVGCSRNGGYVVPGSSGLGGVLWSDWDEPKTPRFPQVVGHTPGETVRSVGSAYCIDVGGKHGGRLAGAWIVDGVVAAVEHHADVAVTS